MCYTKVFRPNLSKVSTSKRSQMKLGSMTIIYLSQFLIAVKLVPSRF